LNIRPARVLLLVAVIAGVGAQVSACVFDDDCVTLGDFCHIPPCFFGVCTTRACPGDLCHPGRCDQEIGQCVQDETCPSDGLACDGEEFCAIDPDFQLPYCDSTGPVDCNDGDPCTVDSPCAEPNGCTHTPVDCNDGDACTSDFCLPFNGGCVNLSISNCCRNSAECTGGDQCMTHACVGNRCVDVGPRDCDDVDTCTADSCDSSTGCVHTPLAGCESSTTTLPTGRCRSGDDCASPCATGRTCSDGKCSDGTPTVCDDGEPCTIDSCDPVRGCATAPRSGFDALSCVCERPEPPSCDGQPVPKSLGKRLARGCNAVSRAATATGRKRTKLVNKAAKQFLLASKQAARAAGHRGLDVDCGNALAARFSDNQKRAIIVRGEK
jgi:hypothetical protein